MDCHPLEVAREDILNLAHQVIDVVIQLECRHGQRRISRIWVSP
jgi:hypothetical protein